MYKKFRVTISLFGILSTIGFSIAYTPWGVQVLTGGTLYGIISDMLLGIFILFSSIGIFALPIIISIGDLLSKNVEVGLKKRLLLVDKVMWSIYLGIVLYIVIYMYFQLYNVKEMLNLTYGLAYVVLFTNIMVWCIQGYLSIKSYDENKKVEKK